MIPIREKVKKKNLSHKCLRGWIRTTSLLAELAYRLFTEQTKWYRVEPDE